MPETVFMQPGFDALDLYYFDFKDRPSERRYYGNDQEAIKAAEADVNVTHVTSSPDNGEPPYTIYDTERPMASECSKCAPNPCIGPCHDFCPCDHCWNGWSGLSWWSRLKERIKYLWQGPARYYNEECKTCRGYAGGMICTQCRKSNCYDCSKLGPGNHPVCAECKKKKITPQPLKRPDCEVCGDTGFLIDESMSPGPKRPCLNCDRAKHMTKEQVRSAIMTHGFAATDIILSVTDDDRASIRIEGDSFEEAFTGNTWEDALAEFESAI